MGLTRRQVLMRIELPLAVPGDHRRPANRRRLDDLDRDDRRVPASGGPRLSDLPRAQGADAVQDRDLLGGRCSRSAWRSRATSTLVAIRRAARAVEPRMTLADAANLHTFVDAVRFIGDHPGFLAHEGARAARALGGGTRSRAARRAAARNRPRAPASRLRRRDRRLDLRPRAAEPRADRGVPDHPRDRLRQQHGRARRARHRPDPDERLRRRRRRRPRCRRGRPRDGHDRRARSCDASSCRSRFRCSSRASGSPPSRSSRRPRSPRSPGAAASATSSSTRRATGSRA